MKACSLTATDENGAENTLSFFLTIIANLMPSLGDASVAAQAYTRRCGVGQQKARKEKDDEMLRQAGIDEEKFRDLSSLLKRSQDAL